MNLKFYKPPYIFSILITFLVYLIILVALSAIYIDQYSNLKEREVFIEFSKYEKIVVKKIAQPKIKKKTKPRIVTNNKKSLINEESLIISKTEISKIPIDSNLISESDSLNNKLNWIDSLVVSNSNLQILKYASKQYIKNNPLIKSDSAKLAEGIKVFMQDYYKSKYPTPVHKFGDGSPGIAIDNILDLFSKSDTVDVEKIKKYLKIGKYN